MAERIRISDRPVLFPKSTCDPKFCEKRVIASSPWDFVALWLRKNKKKESATYWKQSRQFFEAAKGLDVQSAPLPLYYSFLNAAKALLEAKGLNYLPYHGVSAFDLRGKNNRIRLETEGLKLKEAGIAPSLAKYVGDTDSSKQYDLAEIFSNLPFIHRAFTTSYRRKELFLSLRELSYVKAEAGRAKFQAMLSKEHTHGQTLRTLPNEFRVVTIDSGDDSENGKSIETVDTFEWSGARRPTNSDLEALKNFHTLIRHHVNFISGVRPIWYIKRNLKEYKKIDRHSITLNFLAMHRMSEISRYKPIELGHLLEGNRNWIICEYIRVAHKQFIDEIAAEITGNEIAQAEISQSFF